AIHLGAGVDSRALDSDWPSDTNGDLAPRLSHWAKRGTESAARAPAGRAFRSDSSRSDALGARFERGARHSGRRSAVARVKRVAVDGGAAACARGKQAAKQTAVCRFKSRTVHARAEKRRL